VRILPPFPQPKTALTLATGKRESEDLAQTQPTKVARNSRPQNTQRKQKRKKTKDDEPKDHQTVTKTTEKVNDTAKLKERKKEKKQRRKEKQRDADFVQFLGANAQHSYLVSVLKDISPMVLGVSTPEQEQYGLCIFVGEHLLSLGFQQTFLRPAIFVLSLLRKTSHEQQTIFLLFLKVLSLCIVLFV
jgi:hypothetical protein